MVTFTLALRNLFQARRRTLLIAIAVTWVATLFVTLRTVAHSVGQRMIESATTLSSGHVNIGGFFKLRRRTAAPLVLERARLRKLAREIVPEATYIVDRNRGWGRIIGPNASLNSGLSGLIISEEEPLVQTLVLAAEADYKEGGRQDFRPGDVRELARPDTVLLFAGQARRLGVTVGDRLTVVTEAAGGQSSAADLEVVAIAQDMGFLSNWSVFVSRQTLLDLYRVADDTTGAIMIYLPEITQAESVMARLREGLAREGFAVMDHDPNPFFFKFERVAGEDWLGQKLDLTIWSDEVSFVAWIKTALDLIAFFVVGVLAFIIVGGVVNAMWMTVRERTQEIGTMRALGAQRNFVLRLLLCESALLGCLSAAAGVFLGGLLIAVVNAAEIPIRDEGAQFFLMTRTLKLSGLAQDMVGVVLLFAGLTALGAGVPAWKGSRLKPVEALMQRK